MHILPPNSHYSNICGCFTLSHFESCFYSEIMLENRGENFFLNKLKAVILKLKVLTNFDFFFIVMQ